MHIKPWELTSWDERIAELQAHLANELQWDRCRLMMGDEWTAARRADEEKTLAWLMEERDASKVEPPPAVVH